MLEGAVVTSEYKINYLRPATGSMLVARARADSVGTRQAVCRCELYTLPDGEDGDSVGTLYSSHRPSSSNSTPVTNLW